jgi:CRP/FNR family transcriptional regulator/CRP/FNR family cyclic AMP-dependent transcriptional regulator
MSVKIEPSVTIGNIPFFKNLSSGDLIAILNYTETKKYEKDDNLFVQQDPSDGLYILMSGKIQVYIFSGILGEKPKVLVDLGPGNYVGEFGLIDGQPRSASVKALEVSEVMFLPSKAFESMISKHPVIAKSVTDYLVNMVLNLPKFKIKSHKTRALMKQGFIEPNLTSMRTLCWAIRENNKKIAITSK